MSPKDYRWMRRHMTACFLRACRHQIHNLQHISMHTLIKTSPGIPHTKSWPHYSSMKTPIQFTKTFHRISPTFRMTAKVRSRKRQPPFAWLLVDPSNSWAGSFTGKSAVNIGRVVAEDGGLLLCIDPWTGDINMILQNFGHMSPRKNGFPAIYTRFLQQVIRSGLENTILPLPMSSVSGARLVKTLNLQVDVVYLDSAHEFGETFFELNLFWDLLVSGGILVGDDIDYFPSVYHDVHLFVAQKGVQVETFNNTFLIRKP